MELKKSGYSAALCAVAVVSAAARAAAKNKKVSVVKPFSNGPEILVTCMEQTETGCSYVKRTADGILIRAEAKKNGSAGVDLSFGENVNGMIPPELLSCLLTAVLKESKKVSLSICLSSEKETDFSVVDLPQTEQQHKTVAVLLTGTDENTLAAIKQSYGDENVKVYDRGLIPIKELMRSAATNIIFSGSLKAVAEFLGLPGKETVHLLGVFQNGTGGFVFASSPDLLDAVKNRETLQLLQTLSEQQIKAGILITQQ